MTIRKPHSSRVVDLRTSETREKRSSPQQNMSFKRYAFVNRSAPARETPQKKKKKMPLKERRAYKRRGALYAICISLVLCAAGISALTFHSSVAINAVVVEGADHLSSTQVQTATLRALLSHEGMFYSRNTIFTADLGEVAEELKAAFPRIETVSVHRYGINTVKVIMKERGPFATWCNTAEEGMCYHVDATGFIFEPVWGEPVKPELRGGVSEGDPLGKYVLPNSFTAIRTFVEAFRKVQMQSTLISISDDTVDARVSFEHDPDVIVLLDDEPSRVVRTIDAARTAAALKEKYPSLEYIDARFGNRLYYKSKSTETAPEEEKPGEVEHTTPEESH